MSMRLRFFADWIRRAKKKLAVWLPATVIYWLLPAFYVLELESFQTYPNFFWDKYLPGNLMIVSFGLIFMYVLFAAGFFLFKKALFNICFFNALIFAVSLVNYIKYALTGENFLPHDLLMATNLGEIAGFVSIKPDFWVWIFLGVSVFSAALVGTFAKDAPKRPYVRLPVAAVIFAALFVFFTNGPLAGAIFNKFGMYFESTDNQTTNYEANGFVGAFSLNLASFAIQRPEGYSNARLEAALGGYAAAPPAQDFLAPDIILVLSESFWDPRLLPDSAFSTDPLENFDRLSQGENALSGRILVPAYGGGTIRTEFEILTGLSCDALPSGVVPYNIIKKPVASYVSYYKDLGYVTAAIHPYLAKFYRRDTGLPFLGFDEYHAESLAAITGIEPTISGTNISDASFVLYLQYFLDNAKEPLFLFGISIENHQPYRYKYYWENFTTRAKNPHLSEADHHNFENYAQGVQNADRALGELCEYIDSRERPTALVFFGDHLPSICSKYSAYLDTGFIEDIYATNSRLGLYSTPFIIYANFALNKENKAKEPEIFGSYDLLNVLSETIGSGKTRYMSYLEDLRGKLPYYNSKLNMELSFQKRELLKIQYYQTYKLINN